MSDIVKTDTDKSFALALEPGDFESAVRLSKIVASTGLCGITSAEEAFTRIMTGRSLGLSAMQSIRGIYTVERRPALDASLMHGVCMQHPDCETFECVEDGTERVTYRIKRRGMTEQRVTWTLEDARRAGLLSRGENSTWAKYPRAMLHARCKSEAARRVFPERLFGLYTREEIEDGDAGPPPQKAEAVSAPVVTSETDRVAAALKERLQREMVTPQEKRAIREEIVKLPEPWKQELAAMYNERFTKKAPEPAKAPQAPPTPPPREPGDDSDVIDGEVES